MITEVPKENWKDYLDVISLTLDGWETTVEVLSDDIGAQLLSTGLPFSGLTLEEENGRSAIVLNLGSAVESHQTHMIMGPVKVSFEGEDMNNGGILDIEDDSGSKTLIRFIQPFPVLVAYERTELVGVI